MKEALRKLNLEVVDFQVEEVDATVEKVLESDEKMKLEASARFTAHIRFDLQGVQRDAHIRITVFRGPNNSMAQLELTKPLCLPQTCITCCWARIEISRKSKDSTLFKMRLHLSATEPHRRCRLVRRIQHRVAQRYIQQYICCLLCQAECAIRKAVADYEPSAPPKVDAGKLQKALEEAIIEAVK